MKRIKIVGTAILVLSLCIILGITAWANASDVLEYSVTADKTVVCGDKDETVTLTVGIDKTDFVVTSTELWVTVPDGWVIESVTNEAIAFEKGENDKEGMFSWWDLDAEGKAIDYVAKIAVKIPAGTANGDYNITVGRLEMLDGSFNGVVIVPDEITSVIKVGHTSETDKAVAPDCDDTGLTEGSHCSVCGKVLVAQTPIDALGHTAGEAVTENNKAPDCVNEGSYDTVVYCTVCGEELSRVTTTVDALGHTAGEPVTENNKAPDCVNEGSYDTVVYCTVCGEELSRVTTNVDALGHTAGATVVENNKPATCTVEGSYDNVVYCTVCEAELTRTTVTVSVIPHTPGAAVKENNVDPDCENDGSYDTVVYCTVCGAELSRVTTTVDALGHKYESETTPSTCVTHGEIIYTCTECGDEEIENLELDPNNHEGTKVHYNKVNATTHSAIYVCCGAPYVTDEPHTFDEDTALCVCGEAKKFTFTVYGMDGQTVIYTKEVAYGSEIYKYVDKTYVSKRYGDTLAIVEAITLGSEVDYWADNAIMPKGDVALQAYWSGWNIEETGAQYIEKNVVKTGWFVLDDAYYADPVTGYVATGNARAPYPTFAINGITYAPNAEDVAYAASKGIEFIDAESAWFVFDKDGKLESGKTAIVDGKYVENGMIAWHAGLVNIDGELYYFVGDGDNGGNKLANGNVWATRTNGVEGLKNGACYNFKDGQLSGVSGIIDGKYFENSEMILGKGLVKLGDKYIYVRSSGNVVMNAKYYVSANDCGIVSGNYYFDENGYMVNPNTNLYNGVVNGCYYVDGKVAYGAGLIEWNDDIYYVRSNGQVATGEYYITTTNDLEGYTFGQKLVFDENGKLLPVKNGVVDGYYYVNGSIAYGAGLIEWKGDIYYVRSNGQVATGEYYITTTNDLEGYTFGQKLVFDEGGALIIE